MVLGSGNSGFGALRFWWLRRCRSGGGEVEEVFNDFFKVTHFYLMDIALGTLLVLLLNGCCSIAKQDISLAKRYR